MKFQIGELVFEISPNRIHVHGFIETTELIIVISHQIFGGNETAISLKVGEVEVTGKI